MIFRTKADLDNHPCFNKKASTSYGRVHLPVAPHCNIQCNFCNRIYDCANENRPGVTAKAKQWGADTMNCMAMIPVHDTPFENLKSPSTEEIHRIRRSIASDIDQMTHCSRCRADACGKLGER